MANYFSQYKGGGPAALPPGYMEAATAPGRYLAEGFASVGENIAAGLEKYRKNKEKREILTEKGEWVAEQKMQDLALWVEEDPQRVDTPEYEARLKDVQKFSEGIAEMPLGKLESAISNYALDREIEDRRQTMEMKKAEIAESKRRWDVQTGFTERAEQRTLEDREKTEKQEAAARTVGLEAASIPTEVPFSKPGYFEEREVAQNEDSLLDEILKTQGHLSPANALKSRKIQVQEGIEKIEKTLTGLGASRNKSGEVFVNPTVNDAGFAQFYSGDPKAKREKTINVRLGQREEAEQLYKTLDNLKSQQVGLNQIKKEDIEQYLSPMMIRPDLEETPRTRTESVWHPPQRGTRPMTQVERHRKMQDILAEHGADLSVDELSKFRKEMAKLDPNQPSPFKYEKGPNDTWLATHQGTGATVNLGREGHMSATEIGYIHRRAENQLKRLDRAKEAVEVARSRFENAVAEGISSEEELKALQAQWDRAQAALEQEQPILEYGSDGWKN